MSTAPLARLCAPLAWSEGWRNDLGAIRALGIGAIELAPGWVEAPARQVAALAEALREAGMRVALAHAPAAAVTVEALAGRLVHLAPLAGDCLLLGQQAAPGSPDEARDQLAILAGVAEQHGVTLLLQNDPAGWPADGAALGWFVAAVAQPGLRACFDPALSVGQKKHPFLTEFMPGPLKRFMRVLRLRDAVFSDGTEVLPNDGNAELKELVSAAECRGYSGWYALSPFGTGAYDGRLAAAYAAVRALIDSL